MDSKEGVERIRERREVENGCEGEMQDVENDKVWNRFGRVCRAINGSSRLLVMDLSIL